MKILYVLHKFLPRYFSGTEIYTYNLAKEMQERGHEIQIFCADEVEKESDYYVSLQDDMYNGLKVHRVSFNRKKTPDIIRFAYDNPVVADHFKSFLSFNQPDIVHITSFLNLSAAIIDPIKSYSIPAIFTATDFWCFCPKSNFLAFDLSLCKKAEAKKCLACIISLSPFYNNFLKKLGISPLLTADILSFLSRISGFGKNPYIKGKQALSERPDYLQEKLRNLDLIITPSPFLREFFLDADLPPEKILLSEFGLNTDWIKPHDDRPLDKPVRFGYIGILSQLKGVDILIRSFLRLSYPNRACLKIYGDKSHFPHYAQWLVKLAENNQNIFFEDTFSPEKLGEILSEIDVLIIPSIWYENTPLVVLSALAAGVPVVASDVPGISQVVKDRINGLLFPRGDEEALTRCLDRFFQEPDLLVRLRENATPIKSITENGNELESIYNKLIEDVNDKF